jgi:hypothetical protein
MRKIVEDVLRWKADVVRLIVVADRGSPSSLISFSSYRILLHFSKMMLMRILLITVV